MSSQAPASSARFVGTMGLVGMLSGVIIVGAYQATLPRIRRNQAEALRRAVFQVLPGATSFRTLVWRDPGFTPFEEEESGRPPEGDTVYQGFNDEQKPVGYAIPGVGPGYMDDIQLLFGLRPQKKAIVGMQVLESRETPGLGDKITSDEDFLANFQDLKVEPDIRLVKNGTKQEDNEVDGISGATISCRAVVSILDDRVRRWMPLLSQNPPSGSPEGER